MFKLYVKLILSGGLKEVFNLFRLKRALQSGREVDISLNVRQAILKASGVTCPPDLKIYFPYRWLNENIGRRRAFIRKIMQSGFSLAFDKAAGEGLDLSKVHFHVWGTRDLLGWSNEGIPPWCANEAVRVTRYEDGFLNVKTPDGAEIKSFVRDETGIYFDATKASDLELLISSTNLEAGSGEHSEATDLMKLITSSGTSKYNYQRDEGELSKAFSAEKSNVVILGQLEADQSIKLGSPTHKTNLELAQFARAENPDAHLIYKPHPKALSDRRLVASHVDALEGVVNVTIKERVQLADVMKLKPKVYAMSSGAGFEALLYGCEVTVTGVPFYAGWGLTRDMEASIRKQRTGDQYKSLPEVFHAAYIQYSSYIRQDTFQTLTARELADVLSFAKGNR